MKGHHIQINKFKFKNLNFRLTIITEECDNFDHNVFVNNYFSSLIINSEACNFFNRGQVVSIYGTTRLLICNKNNIFSISPQYLLHHIIRCFIKHIAKFNGIDSLLNCHYL